MQTTKTNKQIEHEDATKQHILFEISIIICVFELPPLVTEGIDWRSGSSKDIANNQQAWCLVCEPGCSKFAVLA